METDEDLKNKVLNFIKEYTEINKNPPSLTTICKKCTLSVEEFFELLPDINTNSIAMC